MTYREPIGPIGDDYAVTAADLELVGGRDAFVQQISRAIDACDQLGYECDADGPQIVAWLESPNRRERMLASYRLNLIRQTLSQGAHS